MFLTATNLAHYLLMRGVVDAATIVDGQFALRETDTRNRNFIVLTRANQGLFVKQINELDHLRKTCIRREAHCYQLVKDFPSWAAMMPRLIDFDLERYCLMISLLENCENLRDFHAQATHFTAPIGQLLGQALADLHLSVGAQERSNLNSEFFQRQTPWILTYHQKSRFPVGRLKGACIALGEEVRQRPEFQYHLSRIRSAWLFDSVIHYDLKWDNFLVRQSEGAPIGVQLIDWEFVDVGDAAWDVGSVFQSYLAQWIVDHPMSSDLSTQNYIDLVVTQMPQTFILLHAFWARYAEVMESLQYSLQPDLVKVIEYAGGRLLQTLFESVVGAEHLNSQALALLEISQMLVVNPVDSAKVFFGLEVDAR